MNNNIYVNDDNIIYNYEVRFNEKEFLDVIDDIDTWYGKGELKAFIGSVCPEYPGKKTDIFAEVELDNDKKEYFYYQYIQHPLARTANAILCNKNALESSKLIKLLSTWHSECVEENYFVVRLLSCFEFNRVNLGEVLVLDLTEEDRRSLFDRITDAVKNKERDRFIVVGSKEFHKKLDDEACGMSNSQFGIKTYSEEDKKFTKRRIITGLPSCKDINK